MSSWLPAALCDDCWDARVSDMPGANPSPRLDSGPIECCRGCGKVTRSGIYIKADVAAEPVAPAAPLVSSVVVHTEGAHEAVNVWVRGAHVGKLLVGPGQGEPLRNLLLLEHSRVGRGIVEGERHCDEWLIKDFNVLYRVTRDLLRAVGADDEPTTARALNAVAGQLTRLRPAFTLTEGVRSAARETGTIAPPSSDALANYEATKKAGEGD